MRSLSEISRPDAVARCCNPTCPETCTWEATEKGRPPRFCSTTCRNEYAKTRARVLDHLSAYRELVDEGIPGWAASNEIPRRMRALEMQLDRYPRLK